MVYVADLDGNLLPVNDLYGCLKQVEVLTTDQCLREDETIIGSIFIGHCIRHMRAGQMLFKWINPALCFSLLRAYNLQNGQKAAR